MTKKIGALRLGVEPSFRGMITDAQRLADGQFSLVFAGEFGRPYIVEYSTNLVYWAPFATNVVNGLGVLELTDPSATNRSRSFYRVNAP